MLLNAIFQGVQPHPLLREKGDFMYSVVRENFYDSGKLLRADKEMKEFHSIHAAQLGYRGNIVVDLGGGHMLIITLWESAHLVGAGQVMVNDVSRA